MVGSLEPKRESVRNVLLDKKMIKYSVCAECGQGKPVVCPAGVQVTYWLSPAGLMTGIVQSVAGAMANIMKSV